MDYYKPCKEYDTCNQLIEEYFNTGRYEKCFEGHLALAFYWTKRAAEHGDRDGQYNLAWFYEEGIGTGIDLDSAKYWYRQAAKQGHDLALAKCGLEGGKKDESTGKVK